MTRVGRITLVTGASRGLGQGMAMAFARQGDFVWVGYHRREDKARETLAALQAEGGQGDVLAMDIGDAASVNQAITRASEAHGPIDVLINNAGIARDSLFAMMPEADWVETLRVNLAGTYHVCRAVIGGMMAKRSGIIVNVASVAGRHASPGQANYAASKGGVIALTQTLAAEMAPHGIRVNALMPGLIAAGMAAKLDHRIAADRKKQIPLGRFGSAEEVAAVAVFLASPAASYILGQALVVDGGLTL